MGLLPDTGMVPVGIGIPITASTLSSLGVLCIARLASDLAATASTAAGSTAEDSLGAESLAADSESPAAVASADSVAAASAVAASMVEAVAGGKRPQHGDLIRCDGN